MTEEPGFYGFFLSHGIPDVSRLCTPRALLPSHSSTSSVLIVILVLNFLFWISVVVWRAMSMGGVVTASRRYMRSLGNLLRPPATRSPRQSVSRTRVPIPAVALTPFLSQRSSSINAAERGSQASHHPPPPPYEEAIKYPSISSLLSHTPSVAAGLVNRGTTELRDTRQASSEDMLQHVQQPPVPATKKQMIRSLSCGDLENLHRVPLDVQPSTQEPHTNDTN